MSELQRAMERALSASTVDDAWAQLAPFRAHIGQDVEVASVWSMLLQASPARPGAGEDAWLILQRFGRLDPAVAAAAGTALVRVDELRGPDGPPLSEGPLTDAARELEACFSVLDDVGAADADRGGALRVARANVLRRLGPSHDAAAVALFEEAVRAHGARASWMIDLGLCHALAGRFRAALVAFQKARDLGATGRAVHFHTATAAIGAGDADGAAAAFVALGMPVEREEGALPFVPGLSPVQLRLPSRAPGHGWAAVGPDEAVGFERVWVQPLSPVHGVVRSPTFREAVADWGDVVLFGAAPVGTMPHEGRAVPIFPLLGVLSEGGEKRIRFVALEQRAGQLAEVGKALPEGVVLFEHGARVEQICARCAAGDTLVRHDHEPATEHRAVFGKLLVPAGLPLEEVQLSLEPALRAASGILFAVPGLYEGLGMTAVAGKNHKTWGVIERGALAGLR